MFIDHLRGRTESHCDYSVAATPVSSSSENNGDLHRSSAGQ
jgi:hypothetical protein